MHWILNVFKPIAIIARVKTCEPNFLELAGKSGYVCPTCGNGTGEDGTGIERIPNDTHYKCHICGLHEDVIGLYCKKYNVGFNEAVEALAGTLGITSVTDTPFNATPHTHLSKAKQTITETDSATPPTILPVLAENIPPELKAIDQWLLWKLEDRPNKNGEVRKSKVPKQVNGYNADSTKPATWTSFEQAIAAYQDQSEQFDGIGFVFTKDCGYVGVDIDHCIDERGHFKNSDIARLVEEADSYSERSVSGTGVHIIVKGQHDGRGRRGAVAEIYSEGRYFTFTGRVGQRGVIPIAENQSLINKVIAMANQKNNVTDITPNLFEVNAEKEELARANRISFIQEAQIHLHDPDCLAYLEKRRIPVEVAEQFGLGFVKNYSPCGEARIIIPTNLANGGYIARRIDGNDKPKYLKAGKTSLFNADALNQRDKPVFVVEGELDALSIISVGGQAIALGGTENWNKVALELTDISVIDRPRIVLALDNDDAGRIAQKNLEGALKRLPQTYFTAIFRGKDGTQVKDANEALISDPEQFTDDVANYRRICPETEQYNKNSDATYLTSFRERMKAKANSLFISTGFPALDEILDGGLTEGVYTIGAITSLGKTTFVLQMANNIANTNH